MAYSIVGIITIIITVLVNYDIVFFINYKNESKVRKIYRLFLYSVILFAITDLIWGILDENHLIIALNIDTAAYFLAMSFSVMFWVLLVATYFGKTKVFSRIVLALGTLSFLYAVSVIIANFFTPVLFSFDGEGVYHALGGRYALLGTHVLMFLLMSVYGFINSSKNTGTIKSRYLAVSWFGIVFSVAIVLQTLFPLLPLYACGCLISISVFHVFVVSSEKQERILKEKLQEEELSSARNLVLTDPLTGALSKYAYIEMEDEVDKLIAKHEINEFAVIVFDINGLKAINDSEGHEAGDEYLKSCYKMITNIFKDVPIYRFGGDEFVAIIREEQFGNKNELLREFNRRVDFNVGRGLPIISSGVALFDPAVDNTYRAVFVKADGRMYERKSRLKLAAEKLKEKEPKDAQ